MEGLQDGRSAKHTALFQIQVCACTEGSGKYYKPDTHEVFTYISMIPVDTWGQSYLFTRIVTRVVAVTILAPATRG